ncbi:NAD(P)-binding domain-containing protein [Rothia sp. HC945]|uniref:NAD(P)-binding domain-containing protein n=1 Tax=Rothia sp. HC945 TaxID=3171170 RepID=UPI003F26D9AB
MDPSTEDLPVIVLGAGPIGLACAAELRGRDQSVLVLEQSDRVAENVHQWAHVRMFSPWEELVSAAGVKQLGAQWKPPKASVYPTGQQWVSQYLDPLGQALSDWIRFDRRVVGVSRLDRDLLVESGRAEQPFVIHARRSNGCIERILARAVVDTTGTWQRPSPLGSEGYPVAGEIDHADRIVHTMPDPADPCWAGQKVAVLGSGASALTSLVALTRQGENAASSVVWAVRRGSVDQALGGGENDELPARAALGDKVRRAISDGRITVVTQFRVAAVYSEAEDTVALVSSDGGTVEGLDRIVCTTGFRPDHSFLSEVRLDLDRQLEAPAGIAADIDPNWHSCGSVPAHGYQSLEQPDAGLFIAGIKSYGRAPSFLAMTGFEQVRSIAAYLAGDLQAAQSVQLDLPETGVCGGSGDFDAEPEACCNTSEGRVSR